MLSLRGFPLKSTRRLEFSTSTAEFSKRRVNFCSLGGGFSDKVSKKNSKYSRLSTHLSLSLDKIGCGSGKLLKIRELIFQLSTHLSLSLASPKIGFGSG